MKHSNDIHYETKMAEEVIKNPYLMLLLEHFNINTPLQDVKIREICDRYDISEELFIAFTKLYNGCTAIPELKLNAKDAVTITVFLKTSHHFYSDQIYPEILELINQMKQLNNHKEMNLVSLFFTDYFQEVTEHLNYENEVFHPYVIQLVEQIENGNPARNQSDYSVEKYREHHNDIEEKLNDLKSLLIKYLPYDKDLIVRRKLLFKLSELEFDLKIHSDIEELILIPLATDLENNLKSTEQ